MFDPLLENSPWVQEKLAEREARGEARGELHQAQKTVIRFVRRRFPTLAELASTRMRQATQTNAVNALLEQLWFASDEFAARALLESATLS